MAEASGVVKLDDEVVQRSKAANTARSDLNTW
jgi:hypothetical protein